MTAATSTVPAATFPLSSHLLLASRLHRILAGDCRGLSGKTSDRDAVGIAFAACSPAFTAQTGKRLAQLFFKAVEVISCLLKGSCDCRGALSPGLICKITQQLIAGREEFGDKFGLDADCEGLCLIQYFGHGE